MKKLNIFKIAALTAVFAFAGMFANAQNTTGPELPIQGPVVLGDDGGFVKVIDNKGTVKYLQSQNGITMFTNLTPSGGVVTTWQLGGTLSDNTYIDVDGKEFGIKGLGVADTTLAHAPLGFNMVVVDNTTGEFKTLNFESLIQSGQQKFTAAAAQAPYVLTGITLPSYKSVYVYRNGAKLIANEDYTISGSTITIAITPALPIYAGDIVEVHYIK